MSLSLTERRVIDGFVAGERDGGGCVGVDGDDDGGGVREYDLSVPIDS